LLIRTPFPTVIAATSGLTTLFGILLYVISNSANYFSTTGNIVLGIGAVAGLAATIHGGAVVGRATGKFGAALTQHVPDSGSIAVDSLATLRTLAMDMGSHARVSLILMIVALIGMGSARYL